MNGPAAATAAAAADPSIVPEGAGSANSGTAGGATGNSVTQEDTFAACVAALREEARNSETQDTAANDAAVLQGDPEQTQSTDADVAAYNDSIGGGEYSVDGRTVRPGTASLTDSEGPF
jgi:hypothetical protein